MGIFSNKYRCSTNSNASAPDPNSFHVQIEEKIGRYWVAMIWYPNCSNFEGKKVVVSRVRPSSQKSFDPHFAKGGNIVARFEPTNDGMENARTYASNVNDWTW